MSPCLRRTLLASAISSLASSALWAQETPHLDDMVVTASGFEQQAARRILASPGPIGRIEYGDGRR